MENRAKLSTKILSFFLSVLLAFGSFSIALPGLAPEARAAANYTALKNAFDAAKNAGYLSGSCPGFGNPSENNYTYNDTSDKGYLYEIAVLIAEAAKAETGYNHNRKLRDRIKSQVTGLNVNQKTFIDRMLPSTGEYNSYPDTSKKYREHKGHTPDKTLSDFTYTVKVTRTLHAAIKHDYPTTVPPTNTDIKTAVTLTIPCNAKDETGERGKWYEKKTRWRWEWYTNGTLTTAYTNSQTPDLSAITNYLNYTNDPASFKNGYDEYTANHDCLQTRDRAALKAVYDNYMPKRTPLNGVENFYKELYIGQQKINDYDDYARACLTTYQEMQYLDFVHWIDGEHVDGYTDRDAYLPVVHTPENRAKMVQLRTQATQMRNAIESPSTTPEAIATLTANGYEKTKFDNYIELLSDNIEIYDLTEIYNVVKFRMEHDETECFNSDTSLWGAKNYKKQVYDEAGTVCPVTNEMLLQAKDWFDGKLAALNVTSFEQGNINQVFTDPTVAEVEAFAEQLTDEINYREIQADYNNIFSRFETIRYDDYSRINDTSIEGRIADAEQWLDELDTLYNESLTQIGEERTNFIFGDFRSEMRAFVDTMYEELLYRLWFLHFNLLEVAYDLENGRPDAQHADEVDETNFSLVKRAVADIRAEMEEGGLWPWFQENKNKLRQIDAGKCGDIEQWNPWLPDYDAAVTAAMQEKWDGFEQIELDDAPGSGHYLTRYAGSVDLFPHEDMVRDPHDPAGENEDYEVTGERITELINKIDSFADSEDFAKLLGAYRETPVQDPATGRILPPVRTLHEYIEALLLDKLFNDDMINTIIGSLFPMVTEMLRDELLKVLKDLGEFSIPPEGNEDAAIALNKIMPGGITEKVKVIGNVHIDITDGRLSAYLNGKSTPSGVQSVSFAEVFKKLGIDIFPRTMADRLAGSPRHANYDLFISDLRHAYGYIDAAARASDPYYNVNDECDDWLWFDKFKEDGTAGADGKLTLADFKKYKWNVDDFDSFVLVAGDIFSTILPLLQCIFTNGDLQSATIDNLLAADVNGAAAKVTKPVKIPITIGHVAATGSGDVKISGLQGYNNLWAPIFEALGVTGIANGTSVSREKPFSKTIGTSGTACTAPEILKALVMPLYALVGKLAEKPLDTLLGVLPNLAMYISYDCIQPLVQLLKLNLTLNAGIEIDKESLQNVDIKILGIKVGITGILKKFMDKINKPLSTIIKNKGFELDLSDKVNLSDLIGADITDLNAIINRFVDKAQEGSARPVSIPPINAGRLAHLGTKEKLPSVRTENFSSNLGGGWHYFVNADKPDVFYDILTWLLEFASGEGNLSGLMVNFGQSPLDPMIERLLTGIDPGGALAALVELFCPQKYNFSAYPCYKVGDAGSEFPLLSSSDFVYLKYANNWTRDKAEYFHMNLDKVIEALLNKLKPGLLEGYNGLNDFLIDKVNSIFTNKGIDNVVKMFTKIGAGLADKPTVANLIKDQLKSGGNPAGLDLMLWYDSFGYLTYDYTQIDPETGLLPATAPKRPGDAGYISAFPLLRCEEVNTGETDEGGHPIIAHNWHWNSVGLVDGSDNARVVFTHIFCELLRPLSVALDFLLTGKDLGMFNNAVTIKGYECYRAAIIPLFEMIGIDDAKTQKTFNEYCESEGVHAGFDYLVKTLFDAVDAFLKVDDITVDGVTVEYGPVQKLFDVLPELFYFLQRGGLSVLLKNLLHPIWVLVDTLRPIVDLDIDGVLRTLVAGLLKLDYDPNDSRYKASPITELLSGLLHLDAPGTDPEKIAADAGKVDAIFNDLSIEDLSLRKIGDLVKALTGIDLAPMFYAFEGSCKEYERGGETYGVQEYESRANTDSKGHSDPLLRCKLKFDGADTITVILSMVLDLLRYKDNAAAIDALLPEGSGISVEGIVNAVEAIFKDHPIDMGRQPNWDYLFEGKSIPLGGPDGPCEPWVNIDPTSESCSFEPLKHWKQADISEFHSIYNLKYLTDWTEDSAKATDEVLKGVLDYLAPTLDPDCATFEAFVDKLLNEKVYDGQLFKTIAGFLAQLYSALPEEVLGLVGQLFEVDFSIWRQYVEPDTANPGKFVAKADHVWWSDPATPGYIDTQDEFAGALKQILEPAASILGILFLGENYRLFYTIADGVDTTTEPHGWTLGYGDDALILSGFNAYGKVLVPVLEALGVDLSEYTSAKYVTIDGTNYTYHNDVFVNDLIDIVLNLVNTIKANPVKWLIDILPGLIYFINADGISTCVDNLLGSVRDLIDAINGILPEDQKINLDELLGSVNLEHLNLAGLMQLLEGPTGLHIRPELIGYLSELYVGQLECYTSANGLQAFRMTYKDNVEERHDMITILLALLLEIAEDEGTYTDETGNTVTYDNPAALDNLINGGDTTKPSVVKDIVDVLKNPEAVVYKDINWNYFDETVNLAPLESGGEVNVPGYLFQYIGNPFDGREYTTDWTHAKATTIADGFEGLIMQVLGMTGADVKKQQLDEGGNPVVDEEGNPVYVDKSLGEVLKEMIGYDGMYSGDLLQKLLDLVSPLLFGPDAVLNASLINLLGCMLGGDLTEWNFKYAFESRAADQSYTHDDEVGLDYRLAPVMTEQLDAEGNPVLDVDGNPVLVDSGTTIKTYAVSTREEFIKGAQYLFKPAYRLFAWLLFDDSYEFFNAQTANPDGSHDVLLTLPGGDGYRQGLILLLEALGCEGLKSKEAYLQADGKYDMKTFIGDVADSVTNRIGAILDDPVAGIKELIPELIYFINAGGLQTSIGNLIAGPLALVNKIIPATGGEQIDINTLVTDLLRNALHNNSVTFSLEGINLQYVFSLIELLTAETNDDGEIVHNGLEITDVVGNRLDKFKIGDIHYYHSASGKAAYKMSFSESEDFADFITILLSFVIDVALHEGNAAVIERLAHLEPGLVQSIAELIRTGYTAEYRDVEWFYFNNNNPLSTVGPDDMVSLPDRTINYLTYHSDWDRSTAQYIYENRNDIISAALSMMGKGDTTVAAILKESFSPERDLYTAENLNKLLNSVKGLLAGINGALLDLLKVVLDVDLSAYNTMQEITPEQITGREDFVAKLTEIIAPIYPVLNWLLFGDDIQFFDKKITPDNPDGQIQVLINLEGAEGYAYGLVPLLEALGVEGIPDWHEGQRCENVFSDLVNSLLARVEDILDDPVDEVLELLPNLIYFINANGLSVCVHNLVAGVFALLDKVNPMLPEGDRVDINALIAGALGSDIPFDIDKLDLVAIMKIVEAVTRKTDAEGNVTELKLVDVVTETKMDRFYLGQLQGFISANGKQAFRMMYSEDEGGADMLTVLLNYLVEAALYDGNAAAIESLLGVEPGTIQDIIDMIPLLGTEPDYENYDWNYFGGTLDPESHTITLPKTPFLNYLTYATDWTQSKANYIYDNADEIVAAVLRMTGAEETADTVAEILGNSFHLYTAENLNKLMELVAKLYDALDKRLIDAVGALLHLDTSTWFDESGQHLKTFTDAEITDAATFRAGLISVLKPIYRLLDWLLFGDSIEYFVKCEDGETILLKIAGNKGYANALVPLLEALGVHVPPIPAAADCSNTLDGVLEAVFARVDEILADPVNQALALIPNLFYFINANGLATVVNNLAGSILNLLEVLKDKGIADVNINELIGMDLVNDGRVGDLDLEAIFRIVEEKVPAIAGLKLNDPFKGFYGVSPDGKVSFIPDAAGENIIEKFYLGDIEFFESANGSLAYRMKLPADKVGDLITFLLSFVLQIAMYGNNPNVLDGLLNFEPGTMMRLIALLHDGIDITHRNIDWVYFLNLEGEARQQAIDNVLAARTNTLPELPVRTLHYLEYDNNWSEETVEYLVDNLPSIVDLVLAKAGLAPDLNTFINEKVNIYSDATVNMLVQKIAKMLNKVDEKLLETIGTVLDANISYVKNYVSSGVHDKASFVAALTDVFGKLGRVLDWLLFSKDITLLTELEDGGPATITLKGNDGYKTGLAPLLAAIGVDTEIGDISALDPSKSISEQILSTVLGNACNRIDELFANPIPDVVDLLLELIYFINADGVSACAMNLVSPIDQLLAEVGEIIHDDSLSFANLIHFDLSKIDLEMLCGLLKDKTNIDLWGPAGDYLSSFYFGTLDYYTSYGNVGGFRMVYTPEEDRHDMITILLTVVLDTFVYDGNKPALVKLFGDGEKGEDIYNVIMAFLTDAEVDVPMKPYEWLFTEYADTHTVLSPVTMHAYYNYIYGPLYTREMGAYITKWLPSFVSTMIVLLGVENPFGGTYTSLEDLLQGLIGSSIYTNKNLKALYDMLVGLIGKVKDGIGPDLFGHVAAILDRALGVNLAYWDTYDLATITEGSRTEFVNEVARMLRPAYPLLQWLLTSKDIAFFNKNEGETLPSDKNSYLIIHGAEGYAQSIIPILEAFHCGGVLTPDEYKAQLEENPDTMLLNIVNPLLDKVDEVLADPLNKIVDILPGIIYFINCKGLDSAFRNLTNAVSRVLVTIEPLIGKFDLAEQIGFDFTMDFEGMMEQLLKGLEEKTGFKLKRVALEAIKELTLGEIVSFASKRGVTDYTMIYATGADRIDLVTVILRLILTFISVPENATAIEAMLEGKLNADGYKFLCALLDNFSKMAGTHEGMDQIMYTVYHIFYAANVAAHETEQEIAKFNGDYSFLNQLFARSDMAFLRQIEKSFGDLLNKYTPDIVDDDEVAPNGFIKFFKGIQDFFQKIINFFKKLFKIK